MSDNQALQSWERQPNETSQAFESFVIYRDLGPDRSTLKVSQKVAKNWQLIRRWSSRHHWVNRVADWERHMDREETKGLVRGRTAMRVRQAQMGSNLQIIASSGIVQLAQAVQNADPTQRIKLTPAQLALLAKLGVDIESKARNVDTEGLVQPLVEIHVHETPDDAEVPV